VLRNGPCLQRNKSGICTYRSDLGSPNLTFTWAVKAHGQHRKHSIEFKRQVAQEFLAGETLTLHGLAKRHDICRNLIRVWVQKYEVGAFDEEAAAADLLQQYEARIAALERLVGKRVLEPEFVKRALRSAPRPKSANTFVIVGPQGQLRGQTCRAVFLYSLCDLRFGPTLCPSLRRG
jgi:transposase